MSKPANKTAIGAFVAVFAILLFAGVVFFGSVSFNNDTTQYVIYLEDSVNGLDIGSAVKFKGVKVGSVKSIKLHLEGQRPDDLAIPVVIEIENSFSGEKSEHFDKERFDEVIRQGLRARIQLTSVVTGLLYVDLDFVPGSPVILRGNGKSVDLPEIPTLPSNTAQMMKAVTLILKDLSTADFSALSAQMKKTIGRLDEGIAEVEFEKINDNVVRLTDSAAALLEDPELKKTVAGLNRLIADINALSENISDQVDPVALEIKTSLAELRTTLSEISGAVSGFQKALKPQQGSIGQELNDALVQINDAARAVRALAEYLQINLYSSGEENPNAAPKK